MKEIEKPYHDLYRHIQNLHNKADCSFNILNDDELLEQFGSKRFSIEQLESICAIRYWYRVMVLDSMKYLSKTHIATTDTTIETNLSFISTKGSSYAKSRKANQDEFGINTYFINRTKANCYGKLLLQSELVRQNPTKARILYIGARTEAEVLYMGNINLNPRNITAIDLHSYSPLIKLGDMHSLEFKDGEFDACIMTHCIAYSEAPVVAFSEALRVLKNRGTMIFTVSTIHEDKEYIKKDLRTENKKPRTGAKNLLSFEEYFKIAYDLTKNKEESKKFEINTKGRPFMKAGMVIK